jgi:threonine dehydratase
MELQEKQKLSFVHPFDDPDVIAGQGTIGMEILRQHNKPIEAIFCAIVGGGLISGVAAYVKQIRSEIKIIGVQTVDSDAMHRSLKAKKRVQLSDVGLFADGTAVKLAGAETLRICRKYVDEIILVDTDAVCAAIKDVFQDTRSILEPSGALSVAGAKVYAAREKLKDKTLVTVLSGANMNFDRLHFVAERAEIGEQREAILAVTIPETPGSFRKFCSLLGKRSITEFNYRYSDPKVAQIFVGIQVRDPEETAKLIATLKKNKLPAMDLTSNEMAKMHLRHLVGGRAPEISDEIMYRFEFPERPGALMNFLNSMNHSWNISLFHYRNHGADYGRVLVGMQVPRQDKKDFQNFLSQLGYRYWDESENPAYNLFLV